MTIYEYFDSIWAAEGEDAYDEAQAEAWAAHEDEDDSVWEAWEASHPMIDFEAMEHGEYAIVMWCWDMCGD